MLTLLTLLPTALATADTVELHPVDSKLYLGFPDIQAVMAAYDRGSVGRMLEDEAAQPVMSLMGELGAGAEELVGMLLGFIGVQGTGESGVAADALLSSMTSMSLSITFEGSGSLAQLMPPDGLGLQIQLGYPGAEEAGRAQDAMARLMGDMGSVVERGEDGLTSYTGAGAELWTIVQESSLILLASDSPEGLRARISGEQESFSVEQSGLMQAQQGPREPLMVLRNRMMDGFWASPDLSSVLGAATLEALFGHSATMLLRNGDWVVTCDDSGRFLTTGRRPVPEAGVERILGCGSLVPFDPTTVIPDAAIFVVSSLDKEALKELLLEAMGGSAADLEPMLQGLIEPLGPAVSFSMPSPRSFLSAPPLTLSAKLTDRAPFEESLVKFLGDLEELGEGMFTLVDSEYRDCRFLTMDEAEIDFLDLGLEIESNFVRPTFVVMDDRVFLSTLPHHAKKEVRRLLRREVEVHEALTGGASFPAWEAQMGYSDWAGVLGTAYTAGKAVMALAGESLPFDTSGLPDADDLVRHFEPSLRSRQIVDGEILDRSESSFGPEASYIAVAGLAAAAMGLVVREEVSFEKTDASEADGFTVSVDEDPLMARRTATEASLQVLLTGCEMYRLRNAGKYPEDLGVLFVKDEAGESYLDGDSHDVWGRPFRYEIRDGRPFVWSIGANGQDEKGAGDDIPAGG